MGPDPLPRVPAPLGRGLAFRSPPIDRSFERRVVVAGILIAAAYLVAALASTSLPAGDRIGLWLPLHLALAGGASTAIAAVMPFFVAAFAAVPPADPRLRSAAVGLVAAGALLVAGAMETGQGALAAIGGATYISGIGATGLAVLRPVRRSLGPSRGLVTWAYGLGLLHVAAGGTLATLLLAGWLPMAEIWVAGKPTHAWLNLVGFVSLVIATTLLHFFPTVIGARIAGRRTAQLTVAGVGGGASVAALGTLVGSDALAALGALGVAAGAAGLVMNAAGVWRTRARWTTDADWHRFAMGGLVSAIAWFAAGVAIAAARTVIHGAGPAGWSTAAVAGPLVIGWLGITFLASATHLLPAVGPGSPVSHAAQRRILGRGAAARLALLDIGCLLLSAGLLLGVDDVARLGAGLTAIGAAATVLLLFAATLVGIRDPRPATRDRSAPPCSRRRTVAAAAAAGAASLLVAAACPRPGPHGRAARTGRNEERPAAGRALQVAERVPAHPPPGGAGARHPRRPTSAGRRRRP